MKLLTKLVMTGIILLVAFTYLDDNDILHKKLITPGKEYSGSGPGFPDFRPAGQGPSRFSGFPQPPPGFMNRNFPPFDTAGFRRRMIAERNANIEWIKSSTEQYSPGSWYLLMQYNGLPDSSEASSAMGGVVTVQKIIKTFQYLRGRSRIDLLASMETNVHEIAHAYFDQNTFRYARDNNLKLNRENAEGFIYLSPSEGFFVSFPLKAMLPSNELKSIIPADMRTMRFDTYIDGFTSTQSEGIIGLLNEFHAYYLGSSYCCDMVEPYKAAAGSPGTGLFEWVTHTQSTMSAFYEFDYFIKEYLLFMQNSYPADYETLLSYQPFVEAYRSVRSSYFKLIKKYEDQIKVESGLLNSSGEGKAWKKQGWLWIKVNNSNILSGTPLFSESRMRLLPVLNSRRYRKIEKDFGTG